MNQVESSDNPLSDPLNRVEPKTPPTLNHDEVRLIEEEAAWRKFILNLMKIPSGMTNSNGCSHSFGGSRE